MAKLAQNWLFWPNIGIFGPFGPMPDQKTMQTRCLGVFFCYVNLSSPSSSLFQAMNQMVQKCRYLAKNVSFWPNLALYGPKILIFMGVCKSFGTHITEKTPRQLVCIIVWSATGSNRPKMPIFGQKCQFWAKFGRFWAWPLGTKMCNFDPKIGIFWAKCQFFVW